MPFCNECGEKNDDDAQYCTKCGNYLTKSSKWEKNIEEAAEEIGRKAERFGKRVEKKAKAFAKSMEERSNSTSRHCIGCGTELDSDSIYCTKCGKKVE